MRVLLLMPPGGETTTLAAEIAARAGLALLEGPLGQGHGGQLPWDCLLCRALTDLAETEALDATLDALDSPLDLVLQLDLSQGGLAARLTDAQGGCGVVGAHYRACGLLRRLRGEGGLEQRIRAALRILRDLEDARLSPADDTFEQALAALAVSPSAAPRPAPILDEPAATGHPEARHAPPPGVPRWKAAAQERGRLRRRPTGSHPRGGGRKPRT
jgi:hypothetical protein